MRFVLPVRAAAPAGPLELTGDKAIRFTRAFLSYASEDRAEVLKRAQMLNAAKIGFFQDILSLDPGDAWEPILLAEIDDCDLFLLFWSQAARASQWVAREVDHALERQRRNGGAPPEITAQLCATESMRHSSLDTEPNGVPSSK